MKRLSAFIILLTTFAFVQAQSTDYDKEIGKEAHAEIVNTIGIYNHPSEQYITKVGNRLSSNLKNHIFNYHFFILDMKEPNAMALPGGYIYISRGIIPLLMTEDELAGVIGHEIVHSQARHSINAMKKSILPSVLQIPGNIVKAVISPQLGSLINTPIKFTHEIFSSSYSRQNESEADKFGIALAAKSGYQPDELTHVLERLEKVTKLETHEESKFSFFDSHPMTKKRVSHIDKNSAKLTVEKKAPIVSKNDFLKQFDGIYINENPKDGVFRENVFLQPDMGFVIKFPKDWITLNSPAMVGAVDSTKSAQLFLGVKSEKKSPAYYAEEAKEKIDKDAVVFIKDKKTKVNGHDAYILTLGSKNEQEKTVIHMLWMNMGKYTFLFMAAGDKSFNEVLKKSVYSLRPITKTEKNSIKSMVLRIVEAKEGETPEALSKRTGNDLSTDYFLIINDLKKDSKLKKGQLIKIGRKEYYK